MITSEIIEGIGNEVLLCAVLIGGVMLSVVIRLYNSGIYRSETTLLNSQNSNTSFINESEVIPNTEEVDMYEAGVIDDTPDSTTPNKDSDPQQGSSSDNQSEREMGIKQNTRDLVKAQGHIILRLQYMNDHVRYVHAPPAMPVIHFKRKFFSDEIVHQHKNVRLIFQGRELVPHARTISNQQPSNSPDPSLRRLCDYGVGNESTIHCLISDVPAVRNNPPASSSEASVRTVNRQRREQVDLDIGSHAMLPLFALIIGSTWIFRFAYVEYFNFMSTVSLIILSGMFGGAVLTVSFRPSINSVRQGGTEPAAGDAGLGNVHNLMHATG